MSSDVNTATPRVSKSKSKSKKREFTSPDFVADTKKNRLELDLDSVDPEDLPPLPKYQKMLSVFI